jgi:hypothetical protein
VTHGNEVQLSIQSKLVIQKKKNVFSVFSGAMLWSSMVKARRDYALALIDRFQIGLSESIGSAPNISDGYMG